MTNKEVRSAVVCLAALAAHGCGGGGGGGGGGAADGTAPPPSGWVAGSFSPAAGFAGRCVNPRSGLDSSTGLPYIDIQGTALDQNNWLRSWSNDFYLWYNEIVDRDPGLYATPQYFDLLKTTATTPSGNPKDRFHFTYSTAEWQALIQSGEQVGYGAAWSVVESLPPRRIVVAYTEPGSPAVRPGAVLERGEIVVQIDTVDAVNGGTQAEVDALIAALYPDSLGETHVFTLRHPHSGALRTVNLQAEVVTTAPVQNVRTIFTNAGWVGYVLFNDHLFSAEQPLIGR
jgi:hypothetical protein